MGESLGAVADGRPTAWDLALGNVSDRPHTFIRSPFVLDLFFGKGNKMQRGRPRKIPSPDESPKPELRVVESKQDKTRRLANQRGKQLISYMKLVGNLGRPGYDLGTERTEKLISILEKEFGFMVEQLRHGATTPDSDDII